MDSMQQRRGRYKSTPLVRGLRLQRLKDTTMSITASLDKREAVQLGETILPVPKVYGRKGNQFSDITRLLSGGGGGSTSNANSSAGSLPGGSTVSSSGSTTSGKKGRSMASLLSQPATESSAIIQVDPQEEEDDRQVALILDTQRRRPNRSRKTEHPELYAFESSLSAKERRVWKEKCNSEIVRITRRLRKKYERKKNGLDKIGLFHPAANQMRMDTGFHAELKRLLRMDHIEERCLREMWAESKGEAPKSTRKNATSSAMEDKFASMMSVPAEEDSSTVLDGGASTTGSVKSNKSGKSNKSVASSRRSSKLRTTKKNNEDNKNNNKSGKGGKGGKAPEKSGIRTTKGKKSGGNEDKDTKTVTFEPGDEVNKLEGSRIANETRTQLKNKVKTKFASGEADHEAERYETGEGDEVEEEEEEEDEVWDGEEGSALLDSVNGGSAMLEKSVTFGSSTVSKRTSASGGGGGFGDSMEIGMQLEDGSVVVDPKHPEDRYSEYEIRYDEWGQEVKVKLPPKIQPMAKTKKDTRIDPFAVFKQKKQAEYREKKLRRHRKLKQGDYQGTVTDEDFVQELGYRNSTIRQALGHGKHTPSKLARTTTTPVGSKAVSKPLPGYIRNELRMARKDAGMGEHYSVAPSSHPMTEPSSVPSWAVTTEASKVSSIEGGEGGQGSSTVLSPIGEHGGSMVVGGGEVGEDSTFAMVGESEAVTNSDGANNSNNSSSNNQRHNPPSRGGGVKSSMRQRLENVWEHLEMPHGLKMQFAARYSEPRRAESMNDILPIWEKAARCITMRERLLIVLYNLRQKVAQRIDVHHRDVFAYDEIAQLKSMDSYVDYVQRPMLPEQWVCEMFNAVTTFTAAVLQQLVDEYEDVVTFRGHNYLRLIGEQAAIVDKKGPSVLEPVQYVGNPFLRRTGKLLVNP